MSVTITPTQTQIFIALVGALQTFGLVSASNSPIPIIRGQVNRVPEPKNTDFAVIWPVTRERLALNFDTWVDTQATGSITNNLLTVTATLQGTLTPGQPVFGTGVATGCYIVSQLSGTTGGVGTYSVSVTPNVTTQTLYFGTSSAFQPMKMTMQVDVHGPSSADNVTRIQTLFRDEFGFAALLAQNPVIAPLYAGDPRQSQFVNAEQQIEERWSIDLTLQVNVTVTTAQQFADALHLTTVSVEASYPE